MEKKFLIHIGYPKAGSSSLQQNALKRHSDVAYLSGPEFAALVAKQQSSLGGFFKEIIHNENRNIFFLKDKWENVILPNANGIINVISDERFVMNYRAPLSIAKDLRCVVGPAKILIIIRDQIDLLRSQYDMSPFYERDPDRKYIPFNSYIAQMLENADRNMACSLKYVDIVRMYCDIFGAENVVVASFESIFSNTNCQARLCYEIGIGAKEFQCLISRPKLGGAHMNSYRRLTRRVLGPRPAGKFLPAWQVKLGRAILRKIVPVRKTLPSKTDRNLVESFYEGHKLEDVKKIPGIRFVA